MSSSKMTTAEKRALTASRQRAVRHAWAQERELVSRGLGTRDWSVQEQEEMLEKSSLSTYHGHHMKSVRTFPQYADCVDNVQFLTWEEHFKHAHDRSFRNQTNGYYDTKTREMRPFQDGEPPKRPVIRLSEWYQEVPGQNQNNETAPQTTQSEMDHQTAKGDNVSADAFAENEISTDPSPGNVALENAEIYAGNGVSADTLPGNEAFPDAAVFAENSADAIDPAADCFETSFSEEAESTGEESESSSMGEAGMEQ